MSTKPIHGNAKDVAKTTQAKMREVHEAMQQNTQERRGSDAKSRRQTSYSFTFARIRTKWESKHSEAMAQNTETEKVRITQKKKTAQAEIKAVRMKEKKEKETHNRQKLNCKRHNNHGTARRRIMKKPGHDASKKMELGKRQKNRTETAKKTTRRTKQQIKTKNHGY